ncbi:hypothetical protein CNYM01_04271 [Colletotrichum nymphaeae SA-01]|uniref:Uncharacterized protein n=1 Tax=Colletotrichum nymphaeae SA-01 TaxID=1460502 RepID=A0A135STP8_9PEZI|nr:hypothetical protein CNYM01_04271 [Colletotrichum nymphaeae SA-01]
MTSTSAPAGYVEVIWKIDKPEPEADQPPHKLLKAHWKTAILNRRRVNSLLIRSYVHNTTTTGVTPSGEAIIEEDEWHVTTSFKVSDTKFRTAHGYTSGEHDFNPTSSTLNHRRPQQVGFTGRNGKQPWPAEPLNPAKHTREWYKEVD